MSKGQVVSIDFAIAVSVFVTGLITMIIIVFTLFSPASTEVEPDLDTSFERFQNEVMETISWEIEIRRMDLDDSVEDEMLVYTHTGSENGLLRSSEGLHSSLKFEDTVVGSLDNLEDSRWLTSDQDLEESQDFGNFEYEGQEFSNEEFEASFSGSLEDISIDENIYVDEVDFPGSTGILEIQEDQNGVVFDVEDDERFAFLPGGELDEFYLESITEEVQIEFHEELENVEEVEENSVIVSGGGRYAGITGGSNNVDIDQSGENVEATVTGPSIVFLTEDENQADDKASSRSSYKYSLVDEVRGIDESLLEYYIVDGNQEELDEEVTVDRNYRIEYEGNTIGEEEIPDGTRVIARDLDLEVLQRDGSIEEGSLRVSYWR